MPEQDLIVFKHTEIVETLIKKQGIHKGTWGLYVKFGLKAMNVGPDPSNLNPAAVIALLEIGLQRFAEENSIAVNAAKVNPHPRAKTKKGNRVLKKKK